MSAERVIVGRTHSPCGACAELVELAEGCAHLPTGRPPSKRSSRATQRAERTKSRMIARADLLGAIGYPKP